MQEIKKRRILLASVLKPVDDTRMSEKLGMTLASEYEVSVVGQASSEGTSRGPIRYISLPAMERLSWHRLVAPWRVLSTVFRLRPHVLVVCTSELLPIALCAKLLLGVRIVYDVQENYALNLKYGSAWPQVIRSVLARAVRFTERCTAWAISHYLLSEQSYADELPFIGKKFTVIENKVVRSNFPNGRPRPTLADGKHGPKTLLFSGTLADTTGVFDAIDLTTRLHAIDPGIELLVVGYASRPDTRARLRELAKNRPFIHLEGIDHLVTHQKIMQAIDKAQFGLICYPYNASTWTSYPTKLYEYMGSHLPILLIDNPRWTLYCAPYKAAVVFPPDAIDVEQVLAKMNSGQGFYDKDPADVYWDNEAPKLLRAISSVFGAG